MERDPNSGCWLWAGAERSNGYGMINVDGVSKAAHRLVWEVYRGQIPKGSGPHGTCVLHHCDTPTCVNPAHLFLGTNRDNVRDRVAKKRSADARGELNPNSKLTDDEVRQIRALLKMGAVQSGVATFYGVTAALISRIKGGARWAHLE